MYIYRYIFRLLKLHKSLEIEIAVETQKSE